MKNTQSTDNLKQLFTSVHLPPVDVREQVMERIKNKKGAGKYMMNKKRLAAALVLSVFVLCAVGFAALKAIELRGPGDTPYTFQFIDKGIPLPDKEQLQAEYERLQPGQILAWMKVHDNPKQTIQLFQKPVAVESFEELAGKAGKAFISPSYLPEGYTFQNGQLSYKLDDAFSERMKEECKNTDKEYIIHVFNPTNELSNYSLYYKNGDQAFDVTLFYHWQGNEIMEVGNGAHMEKVKVKDFEAVYTANGGRTEVKWLKNENGANTLYSIGAPAGFLSKEEMLKIAESLN